MLQFILHNNANDETWVTGYTVRAQKLAGSSNFISACREASPSFPPSKKVKTKSSHIEK